MRRVGFGCVVVVAMGACTTVPSRVDYYDRVPRVILVLPPVNQTGDLEASNRFLATVTRPLAEQGYYVPPVALVDRMMKENGLPTPGDMRTASIDKLREVFGADAVLYIDITDWGAAPGGAKAGFEYRLVDARSGAELWRREQSLYESYSSGAGGGVIGTLVGLAIATAAGAVVGPSPDAVRAANRTAFSSSEERLLLGPHHPDAGSEQAMLAGMRQ